MIDLKTQALQALADRRKGHLEPEAVIEAARPPESPLHKYFEWEDSVAAHAYRLQQARELIRSVHIEVRTSNSTVVAPLFIRDPNKAPTAPGYVSISRLLRNDDAARAAILAEFGRVASALERAKAVAAALNMTDEIDTLLASVTHLQARLSPAEPKVRARH